MKSPSQPKCNERINNRLKRINLKSKRLRNMFKKGIELSQMCDLDIAIVIRDREMNKVTQYTSGGSADKDLFTIDEAVKAFKREEYLGKVVKTYTDGDYNELKCKPKDRQTKSKKTKG